MHTATRTLTTTHQAHYELAESVHYIRRGATYPLIPDSIVSVSVFHYTGKHAPKTPTLVANLRSGRSIIAGTGQNPDERDDTLLTTFADLIADAAKQAPTLDQHAQQAEALSEPAYLPPASAHRLDCSASRNYQARCTCTMAVFHLGTTRDEQPVRWDNSLDEIGEGPDATRNLRPTHVCQHGNQYHPCACPAGLDHGKRICQGYDA